MRRSGISQLSVDVDQRMVEVSVWVLFSNDRQRIGLRLRGDHRHGGHIPAGGDLHTHDLCAGLNDNLVSHLCAENQCLHSNKRVVSDTCRTMHLRLVSDGHPFPNMDRVLNALDFYFILRHFFAVFECFEAVNYDPVLYVALIADVNILSLISSNRRKGGATNTRCPSSTEPITDAKGCTAVVEDKTGWEILGLKEVSTLGPSQPPKNSAEHIRFKTRLQVMILCDMIPLIRL